MRVLGLKFCYILPAMRALHTRRDSGTLTNRKAPLAHSSAWAPLAENKTGRFLAARTSFLLKSHSNGNHASQS